MPIALKRIFRLQTEMYLVRRQQFMQYPHEQFMRPTCNCSFTSMAIAVTHCSLAPLQHHVQYECETAFSWMTYFQSKYRTRLNSFDSRSKDMLAPYCYHYGVQGLRGVSAYVTILTLILHLIVSPTPDLNCNLASDP